MMGLPRQLSQLRPAPGLIKVDYEDFHVTEIPLYAASGEGTHTYFEIEKRGLSTMQAIHDLAHALGVRRFDIGCAGLKDARGVTRQWMSLEHVEPERVAAVEIPRIRVLSVSRHRNKLRRGHLRANRFRVRVRQTDTGRLAELQDGLAELARVGVPNYFGEQRFGGRGDTWEIGRAIVRNELDSALDIVLGRAGERDRGDVRRARQLYDAGDFEGAAAAWPRMFRDQRRALKALIRARGNKRRGFLAIDENMRRFYVQAYQSHLFNRIVMERLPGGLGTLIPGDLAMIHVNGAVFRVEDVSVEQPRADGFEISPTGPLFGYRMTAPEGEPGRMEADLFAAEGLDLGGMRGAHLRIKGLRRPLRFQPREAGLSLGADERGPYLEVRFELPTGCYATSLLRELFVGELSSDGDARTGDGGDEAGEE